MNRCAHLCGSLFFVLIVSSSLAAADSCEQAREATKQCDDKSDYVDKRIQCYKDSKSKIEEVCIIDMQNKYDRNLDSLLKHISSKYDGVSKLEKEKLSEIKRSLKELSDINAEYILEFKKRGQEIALFSNAIRNEFIPTFDVFHQNLMENIEKSKAADDPKVMREVMNSIDYVVFEENKVIYEKINALSSIRFTNNYLHDRYQSQIGRFSGFIEEFDLGKHIHSIKEPEVLNKIDRYLHGRHDEVQQKASVLRETLDKKLNALISRDVNFELDASMQTSIMLSRKAQFLDEINMVVTKFQSTKASTYNNLPFQAPAWESALELEQLVDFCESSSAIYWHSLGCNRVLGFKSAVKTKKSSSIPNAMRFALMQIGFIQNSPMPDVQQYVAEAIEEGRIEDAVHLFDNILKQMETHQ